MISPHSKRSSAFQLQLGFCPTHQITWSHLLQPSSCMLAAFHFLEYSLPPPGVLRERSQSDIWSVGQSLSCVPIFATPRNAALQASLSFTLSWSLLKLMSIEQVMPSIYFSLVTRFSSCPQPFPASGSFPVSQLFVSGGQRIGTSASASVLPMNIQSWFPLGLTDLISSLSKGLSRVFSNTTVQNHQLFNAQFFGPTVTSIHDYWKNHSLTIQTFAHKVMSLLFNMLSRFVRASLVAQLVKNLPAMRET